MVRYEEPPKKYSTIINPEIDDPYDVFLTKKHEILQKIERKKHLILLAKSMSDAPVSDGGISREKAQRTVELLNKDISKLEKDLRQLESINVYGENIASATDDRLRKSIVDERLLKPLDDETKSLVFKRLEENKKHQDTSQSDTEIKTNSEVQNTGLKLKEIDSNINILCQKYNKSQISRDEYFDTLYSLNEEKRKLLYGELTGLNERIEKKYLDNEKKAQVLKRLDESENTSSSSKKHEYEDKLNHICQYCFKKVSQVYRCTKCDLELCSEHVSNHSCIKAYKVDKTYLKESLNKSPIKPVAKKVFKFGLNRLTKFWNKIKYKLYKKPYYDSFNSSKFFNVLVWMIILSLTFAVLYYNIDKINKIVILFPLGNVLLLTNGIFWIKYAYQLLKGMVYWYRDQRNWMKYFIVLIILLLALQSYQQKETMFNPLVDSTNKNPVKFDLGKEVIGWWNENKPKAGFNPKTYDIENIVFTKMNEERKKRGLLALTWDSKLAEVARLHSLDMANRSYFSHENPEGEDPTARAIRSGYDVHKEMGNGWYSDGIAENIGMMPTGNVEGNGYVSSSNDVANAMMKGWMNSPGHRANILDASYDFIGVGVSYNGYGTYYLTQNFK